MPESIRVVGDDIVDKYLLLANGHDGTMAVMVMFTPIRVVCQNTLNLALGQGRGLAIKHYRNVGERVSEAAKLMGIANQVFDQAGVTMQRSARVPKNIKGGYPLDASDPYM